VIRELARWIATDELLLLTVVAPLFIFPTSFSPLGLLLIFVVWLCRWRTRGQVTVHWPLVNTCMSVILLMLPVSLFISDDRSLSWQSFYLIVLGIAFFFAIVNGVWTRRQLWWISSLLLALAGALCLLSLVGTDWPRQKVFKAPVLYAYWPRLFYEGPSMPGHGAFHPNVVGGTLTLFIPLALSVYFSPSPHQRGWLRNLVAHLPLALLILLLLFIVVLTQSRGAWLALAAGLWVMVVARYPRLWWEIPIIVGLVFLAGRAWAVPHARELFLGLDSTGTSLSRLAVWGRALAMMRDAPLTGIGLNLFSAVVEARYPLPGPEVAPPHAHNLLLQVGVDLGLPGMIAYLVLLVTCLVRVGQTVTAFRTRENANLVALSAGLLGSLVVASVHGLLDAVTWVARSSPLLWILLALSLATYRFSRQKAVQKGDRNAQTIS
jgi:putative inorganic carbon (HCO3(-)) transporter